MELGHFLSLPEAQEETGRSMCQTGSGSSGHTEFPRHVSSRLLEANQNPRPPEQPGMQSNEHLCPQRDVNKCIPESSLVTQKIWEMLGQNCMTYTNRSSQNPTVKQKRHVIQTFPNLFDMDFLFP